MNNTTLPQRIASLQQKVRELKSGCGTKPPRSASSSLLPAVNTRLTARRALMQCEQLCRNYDNKENVNGLNRADECHDEKAITKEQSSRLGRILMMNTTNNVSEDDSDSEDCGNSLLRSCCRSMRKSREGVRTGSQAEISSCDNESARKAQTVPAEFEGRLRETERVATVQAGTISALARRNAFLEARNVQQVLPASKQTRD